MRQVAWPLPVLALVGVFISSAATAQTSQTPLRPVVATETTSQQPNTQPGQPWSRVDFRSAEQRSGGGGSTARGYAIRPFIGIIDVASSTGMQLGVGVAGRPFNNGDIEVQVDGSFIRLGGGNGFGIAPSLLYNFKLDSEGFTPFAGAGLNIIGDSNDTDWAFQILGGVEVPLKSGQAFRGELRIGFFDGTRSLAVLGGLSF